VNLETAEKKAGAQNAIYGAQPLYILALVGMTVASVLGSAYVSNYERHVGIFMWALTGLSLLALATVATLRVRADADGLTQRWLFSHLSVKWRNIARLDKTRRGYALRDEGGKDVGLLFLLPPPAQQSIAETAITHARLRPSRTTPTPPILEQWERKPK